MRARARVRVRVRVGARARLGVGVRLMKLAASEGGAGTSSRRPLSTTLRGSDHICLGLGLG